MFQKRKKNKTKDAVLYCILLVVQWIDWIPFTSLTYLCTVVYVLNLRKWMQNKYYLYNKWY